jgi:hypothetical protein
MSPPTLVVSPSEEGIRLYRTRVRHSTDSRIYAMCGLTAFNLVCETPARVLSVNTHLSLSMGGVVQMIWKRANY